MEHIIRWRCACPVWVEHRRVLMEAISGGDLPRSALVEAIVQGGPEVWEAVTSFWEAFPVPNKNQKLLIFMVYPDPSQLKKLIDFCL